MVAVTFELMVDAAVVTTGFVVLRRLHSSARLLLACTYHLFFSYLVGELCRRWWFPNLHGGGTS